MPECFYDSSNIGSRPIKTDEHQLVIGTMITLIVSGEISIRFRQNPLAVNPV